MKVLISGSSQGIGRAISLLFLEKGHEVYGLDMKESSISHPSYHHFVCDIKKRNLLPEIDNVEILINNAGVQNSKDDIDNNLKGTINVTEKYAFQNSIKSILFNISASASSGSEFPLYVASKSGLVGYMRNTAMRVAIYHATCNSISLGGVLTESNRCVMEDNKLWDEIMSATPLKKWATEDEISKWVYFLTIINKSMSGEDLLIDNGEMKLNQHFVWPEK